MEQLLAAHDAEFTAGRQHMADLLGHNVSVTRAAFDASNDNLERLFAEREARLSSAGDRWATLVDGRAADMRDHIDQSAATLSEAFAGHRAEIRRHRRALRGVVSRPISRALATTIDAASGEIGRVFAEARTQTAALSGDMADRLVDQARRHQ